MPISDILRALRVDHGMTQEEFGRIAGVSDAAVSTWEAGTKEPRMGAVSKIANYFGLSIEEVIGMADMPEPPSPRSARIGVYGLVPAGVPLEAIEDILDWEEIPLSMCSGGREYFGLQVKGDSMWPDYLEGDVVIVQKTPVCESGDDCVVYINGYDATLKRVKLGEDGSLTIIPRNQNYSPRTYSPEEVRDLPVSIAGVVVELRRKMRKAEG